MLETYSQNVTIAANAPIPFNVVSLRKGCTAIPSGTSDVALNKRGVYMVHCSASIDGTATAPVTIQLRKNGVLQPQALSASTTGSLSFETLVQVSQDNNCNCCTAPTLIDVVNLGTAEATFLQVDLVVTKLC